MAADSAVMVIDASNGRRGSRTRKLFKVCVMRKIPFLPLSIRWDRDANDTFDLLDDTKRSWARNLSDELADRFRQEL